MDIFFHSYNVIYNVQTLTHLSLVNNRIGVDGSERLAGALVLNKVKYNFMTCEYTII